MDMMDAVKIFIPIWCSTMVTMVSLLAMVRSAEFAALSASKLFTFLMFCAFSFIATVIAAIAYKIEGRMEKNGEKR